MSSAPFSLAALGWRACFSQQLTLEEFEHAFPTRIANVHRSLVIGWSERGVVEAAPLDARIAVGDWALLDTASHRLVRVLERETYLSRISAGSQQREQPIAANIDTAFLVTSCNHDFNVSRLERYLALTRQARIEPVIVLTKADLAEGVDDLLAQLAQIAPTVAALAMNALDPTQAAALLPWLRPGSSAVLLGSSGVGKSTLTNTLTGEQLVTYAIREDDSRGRHATTARHMIAVPNGGWIIDTPGMRELNIGAAKDGVRATFDDVEAISRRCRFRDCTHEGDAGCAVAAALRSGELARRRFESYLKLRRETRHAAQTERERREAGRRFGKLQKKAMKDKARTRDGR